MTEESKSIIVRVVCCTMVPFMQLFAFYIIIFGHYGPGGGFQGGVILAASIILQRMYLGKEASHQRFPPKVAPVLATLGMLVYVLAGFIPMTTGGMFLDYGNLPIPNVSGASLRALGISIVEVGIGLAVFGTMVLLFDTLAEGKR